MTRLDDSPVPDYANRLRLDDRRFVVIGAGQGIGRQTAHALAANGARLLCVDVDPGLAEDIAGEVGGTPWSGDATKVLGHATSGPALQQNHVCVMEGRS